MGLHRRMERARGMATVEFAMVLPVMVMLALPVVDYSRALGAGLILTNMSREGASLASRSSLPAGESQPYQNVMGALAATAPPLDMGADGMIYVTKIMGYEHHGVTTNIVIEQYRWAQGWHESAYAPPSAIWNCGGSGTSWVTGGTNDGACGGIPSPGASSPVANIMTGEMVDGDVVFVVETFYRFHMLFGGRDFGFGAVPTIGPDLSAVTVM